MLKICYYGELWIPIIKELEKKGYIIFYNQFSENADIVIIESPSVIYNIYPILKKIKKHKIKLVNFLIDVPPWRLSIKDKQNHIIQLFFQYFYHIIHKHCFLDKILTFIFQVINRYKITKKPFQTINLYLKTCNRNKIYYYILRNFLKNSDLNLSISKFTQFCFKKLLNVDSKVWYPSVNSKLIENIRDLPIEYDMINISRITSHKRQNLIVDASKKLGLNLLIIGKQQDKDIKLDCHNFYIPDHLDVMKELKKSNLYIDASIFEGFGMTPIEAAFLEKVAIVSDTYIHREILGKYPLYFIKDDLNDLMKKINQALNEDFKLDKISIKKIKKKYSIKSAMERLEKFLNQLYIEVKVNNT